MMLAEAILFVTDRSYMRHYIELDILEQDLMEDDDEETATGADALADGEQVDRDPAVNADEEETEEQEAAPLPPPKKGWKKALSLMVTRSILSSTSSPLNVAGSHGTSFSRTTRQVRPFATFCRSY